MNSVENVHVVFKTHLDLGFTNLASQVVAEYFSSFLPKAIETAERLRQFNRPERLIWTTGSWLIYEYLEQASSAERKRMEAAILAGDIVWHGLPFTFHSELLDPSLFRFGLRLSQELDQRFGKKTIAAKMTDVPGHTRGIVPLLAEAGITLLHIGVNDAVSMPAVPPLFRWEAPGGESILVLYHHSYDGTLVAPDGKAALALEMTYDNVGPPQLQAVVSTFMRLRAAYPGAQVVASTLDQFAAHLLRSRSELPVVTEEIGDTWIHGVGTDPKKVREYRELCRLRSQWLAEGRVQLEDPAFGAFSRSLLLVPEHTWGLDTIMHLADFQSYDAQAFRTARADGAFTPFEASWQEQRSYLSAALEALGTSPLRQEAEEHLQAISPTSCPAQEASSHTSALIDTSLLEAQHFTIGFDQRTGAITHLMHKPTQHTWATADHPLALFRYETYGTEDYQQYRSHYVASSHQAEWWVPYAFGKYGMPESTHQTWLPELVDLWREETKEVVMIQMLLHLPEESVECFGAPRHVRLVIDLPQAEPVVRLDVQWEDKSACRLPEALWLSFQPPTAPDGVWTLDKLGQQVSPLTVVPNGNPWLHAVGTGVTYSEATASLAIETLDAPLVAQGRPHLLRVEESHPNVDAGVHINLFNNLWCTNFPLWTEENARFRFALCPQSRALI